MTGNMQLITLDFATKTAAEATESTIQIEKVIVADAEEKERGTGTASHKIRITAEDPEPDLTGDINKDGVIDLKDLVLVARKITE